MGSCGDDTKGGVKTGLATVASYLYTLFMGTSGRRNGILTRCDAMLHRETLVRGSSSLSRNMVMLDIVFIGIVLVFFAACLGYTLACERM